MFECRGPQEGLVVLSRAVSAGKERISLLRIGVNATESLSFNHVILAGKVGATFVAPRFSTRIMQACRQWCTKTVLVPGLCKCA